MAVGEERLAGKAGDIRQLMVPALKFYRRTSVPLSKAYRQNRLAAGLATQNWRLTVAKTPELECAIPICQSEAGLWIRLGQGGAWQCM